MRLVSTRKRKVFAIVILTLVLVPMAYAAWIAASGSGVAGGSVATPSNVAITITTQSGAAVSGPGGSGSVSFRASQPGGSPVQILSVTTGTLTATGGGCPSEAAAHITPGSTAGLIGQTIPAGGVQSGTFNIGLTADASLPACLGGANLSLPVTVTASGT